MPTYNEKENLRILVPKILEVFKKNQLDGEIVIVDDRSQDGSFEYLSAQTKLIPELRVIFRSSPPSLSRAWFEGFEAASKKNLVCIDADLCHDPQYFPAMLEKMKDFDMVIGSRYLKRKFGRMEGKSFMAATVSLLGQFLTRVATGLTEYDSSHSFRLFKKSVFEAIKKNLKEEGNVFLIEFLFLAKKEGARVTEIPIQYGKRIHGSTKLKIYKESLRYLRFMAVCFFQRFRGRRWELLPKGSKHENCWLGK